MKRATHFSLASVLFIALATTISAFAQRSRTVSTEAQTPTPNTTTTIPPAPQSIKAKYEGGILGYNKKQTGTLNFDDASQRLVFRDKTNHEYISISYKAIAAAYGDTQSRRPTGAMVAGSIPAPYGANLLSLLVRKKYRYLVIQFDDPDTHTGGITSFHLDNKETLASELNTLANKAGLVQRGEAFVRGPNNTGMKSTQPPE